ncbi:MAG: DMT family transporter [Treponema sp.]|nr:DMT family transporter [Treponema sp.]
MNKNILRADLLLLLTAAIWGFGFVAQRSGMEYVGPFAYNVLRFVLGSLSLVPLVLLGRRKSAGRPKIPRKTMLLGSLFAGICLFVGQTFQQLGIMFTSTGNAGFITGLYVVLVPIFGIFLGHKTGIATWIGAALTFAGLYFLANVSRPEAINPGDLLVMVSAVFWAVHVLVIDRLVRTVDAVVLSLGQFSVCAVLMIFAAFFLEPQIHPLVTGLSGDFLENGAFKWLPLPDLIAGLSSATVSLPAAALIPILYGGLCSVGIAYTLQVVAQKDAPPAHATIILSFEGSFAALGGVLLLSETVSSLTLLGFVLMLAGMLVSQWELIVKKSGPI